MRKCVFCQADLDDSAKFCAHCGKEQPTTANIGAPQKEFINPFYEEHLQWYERYFNTAKAVLFNPTEFFMSCKKDDELSKTLPYYFTILVIGALFSAVWNSVTDSFSKLFSHASMGDASAQALFAGMGFFSLFILMIIGGAVSLFLVAGIYHLLIMMFGEDKFGFIATLNAVIFSYTTNLLVIIPFCGSAIAGIWGLVMYIFGIKHMQEMSWGKAVVVVLIPGVLCCCTAIVLAIAIPSLIAGLR